MHGWWCWLRCFRDVFPLVVGRPQLPGFTQFLHKAVGCPFMQRQVSWSRQYRSVCSCSSWTRLWACLLSACQALVVTVPKTVAVSQLQFFEVYDRCRHRLEVPQLQFIFKVVDFTLVVTRLPI